MSEQWTFEKMVHPDQRVAVYGYYLIRSNQNDGYVAFVDGEDNAQKIAQAPAMRELLERCDDTISKLFKVDCGFQNSLLFEKLQNDIKTLLGEKVER